MSVPRLYLPATLGDGSLAPLGDAQAHYLRNVLRLQPGAAVIVFNAECGEFDAVVAELGKRGGAVQVGDRRRPVAPEPGPWLVLAPVKRARLDSLVQQATELGVERILPVWTRRTSVERVNLDRLAAIAVEAAEQCERLSVPVIDQPVALDRLAWPAERALFVADEQGGEPIGEVRGTGPWAYLTGPEGGFAPGELDRLAELATVRRIGLGPRILRAETAAIAGLAVLQARLGDWTRAPQPR